jgi:hypothetical protein
MRARVASEENDGDDNDEDGNGRDDFDPPEAKENGNCVIS